MRFSGTSVITVGLLSACATHAGTGSRAPRPESSAPFSNLTSVDSAAHVLSRLTFGPRPGEVNQVLATGIGAWIRMQLHPEGITDSSAARALQGCEPWTGEIGAAVTAMNGPMWILRDGEAVRSPQMIAALGARESAAALGARYREVAYKAMTDFDNFVTRDSAKRLGKGGEGFEREKSRLVVCRFTRAEASDQQLLEVMTDFWENHFSVFGGKIVLRGALLQWDREAIRPQALGKFRDLIGAVARSPAMLSYLDNDVSIAPPDRRRLKDGSSTPVNPRIGRMMTSTGLNENFARELLELHTLGAAGGFTQADVSEVARAFTGWTHSYSFMTGYATRNPVPLFFVFDSTRHDADPKLLLGRALPAGRGLQDGEEVLDLLAAHPSTARWIAFKLARRFVADDPPPALVERAAGVFQRTDGDIREVVRAIVTSPEFFALEAYRAKVKSPLELVLSLRRAMAAPVDTAAEMIDFLLELGQPPFGKTTPEGWPETAAPWMTADGIRIRMAIAQRVAAGDVASIPMERWPGWNRLRNEPFDRQMDGVIELLLNGRVSTATRAAMTAGRSPAGNGPSNREAMLRDLIAMALSSPEFQRR